MKNFKELLFNKKFILISSFVLIISILVLLNFTLGIFSNRRIASLANIKVSGLEYSITVNGTHNRIITALDNDTTKGNVVLTSLNKWETKYELTYKVCSDSSCNNFIDKPDDLIIEYSSKTTDPISDVIISNSTKQMRIVITNNTSTTYYIMLDVNAGFVYNTLALQNLIATEYNEEEVTIAAIIEGEISTTFPTTSEYNASVTCTNNNGSSNATGTVTWNGSKWVVNITGVDSGRTICNVYFNEPTLKDKILAQGGGAAIIEAKGTPDFNIINGISGLYVSNDEYGKSYYYRGLKTELNNNLIWGGFQWKIVRINGDGSIRLIYNGTEAQFNTNGTVNDTGTNTQILTAAWNTNTNDAKYVGYMYGGTNGVASTSRAGAVLNETSANVKTVLDTWYQTNIEAKGLSNQVVDILFCNDRQLHSGPGYGNTGVTTNYAANNRLVTKKTPTLKCGDKNDQFTTSADTTTGNGALIYPIGLITADELSMAGLRYADSNIYNYLYTNRDYWSLSPYNSLDYMGIASIFYVYSLGDLDINDVDYSYGIRPAVSINSETQVTGTGSATDPYVAV